MRSEKGGKWKEEGEGSGHTRSAAQYGDSMRGLERTAARA